MLFIQKIVEAGNNFAKRTLRSFRLRTFVRKNGDNSVYSHQTERNNEADKRNSQQKSKIVINILQIPS